MRVMPNLWSEVIAMSNCEANHRYLSADEIDQLNRDLRIVLASNGTLTRTLKAVYDDEISVSVIKQEIADGPTTPPESGALPLEQLLRRQVALNGRTSGALFVAAESLIAINCLPSSTIAALMETKRPLGEVLAASRLETFKESAQVWIGNPPEWVPLATKDMDSRIVARRYRIIAQRRPLVTITEYFAKEPLQNGKPGNQQTCKTQIWPNHFDI
jgi:chorismate lyase